MEHEKVRRLKILALRARTPRARTPHARKPRARTPPRTVMRNRNTDLDCSKPQNLENPFEQVYDRNVSRLRVCLCRNSSYLLCVFESVLCEQITQNIENTATKKKKSLSYLDMTLPPQMWDQVEVCYDTIVHSLMNSPLLLHFLLHPQLSCRVRHAILPCFSKRSNRSRNDSRENLDRDPVPCLVRQVYVRTCVRALVFERWYRIESVIFE